MLYTGDDHELINDDVGGGHVTVINVGSQYCRGGLDGKGNNVVLEVVFVLYSDFDCKECNCHYT